MAVDEGWSRARGHLLSSPPTFLTFRSGTVKVFPLPREEKEDMKMQGPRGTFDSHAKEAPLKYVLGATNKNTDKNFVRQ